MAFGGWKGDFVGFFRGLELDNSRRYFEAHRKQYELDVRSPMEELLKELEPSLGPGKLFRINRDIRFSADKSPYKTNIGAVAGPLYIHMDARQFFVATGAHMPDNAWLKRYRGAVAGPAGEDFERRVERIRKAGLNVGGNPLKTAPRGYTTDHQRIEMLRWREVVTGKDFGIQPWIATPAVKEKVLETWEIMRPLHEWLKGNVGAA